MIDIAAYQSQMNTLKQVPVSVAHILLTSGQNTINGALAKAKSSESVFTGPLPGGTARANCAAHLKWHQDELQKYTDQNAMYPNADDLKKWVMQSYIEANAVEEGATWIAGAWSQMWAEIGQAIKALPVTIAAKINETASSLLGLPTWGIGLAVLGFAGIIGYLYLRPMRILGGRS